MGDSMPTQKFTELCEYKKRAVLDAMQEEFLQRPYSEIRIGSVTKRAGISRASFYTYFAGKDDILLSMMEQMIGDLAGKVPEFLREQKGIFSDGMKRMLFWFLEEAKGRLCGQIYNRVMGTEVYKQIFFEAERAFYQGSMRRSFMESCYREIDKTLYSDLSKEQLASAVDIAVLVIIKAALFGMEGKVTSEKLIQEAEKQLRILDRGIRS